MARPLHIENLRGGHLPNDFVRNSGLFDGVADFAAVTEDPADPSRLLPAYDTNTSVGGPGDHLHPNRAGFLAMGHAVDLAQLKRG